MQRSTRDRSESNDPKVKDSYHSVTLNLQNDYAVSFSQEDKSAKNSTIITIEPVNPMIKDSFRKFKLSCPSAEVSRSCPFLMAFWGIPCRLQLVYQVSFLTHCLLTECSTLCSFPPTNAGLRNVVSDTPTRKLSPKGHTGRRLSVVPY